jgi:hypothetical protein
VNDEPQGAYRKHGHPAETIGLAAVAALGLEAILPSTGAPGWVLPASEILASSGAAVVTWGFTGRKVFPLYMTTLGAFLGAWTAWAGSAGLWHWSTFGTLLAGMAAFVPLGVAAWHKRKAPPPEPLMLSAVPEPLMLPPEPDDNEVQRDLFATMFLDHGLHAGKNPLTQEPVPLAVTELTEERWGRQMRIALPKSGNITIEDFRAKASNFDVALEAQDGAVSFETGATASEVIMKVRERDGMAGTATLTQELRARTVNETFAIGVQEDGSYLKVTVRESHIMIIGIMGSGKSNLLNVLIAQLASMVDTVVWMIDMKGGRAGKPWFQAWSEGKAAAPPIDWLATTRDEAELMLTALRTAVDTRSNSGVGGNKIIPSPDRPQIIFICDEMADLFGDSTAPTRGELGEDPKLNTWFQKQGVWLTQHARSEAVATCWASQRGTNGMSGTGDMKANIDVSIALKPKKASDLQYILEDVPTLAARQVSLLTRTPGVGMLARGPHNSQITKFLHHDHIEGVCGADESSPRCPDSCPVYQTEVLVGPVRPRLDRMTAQALGTDYAQRWVRAQRAGTIRVPAMALSAGSAMHGYSNGNGGTGGFERVLAEGGVTDPERDLHPAKVRMRELLAASPYGLSVAKLSFALKDEMGNDAPVRETIHRWLREDRAEKLAHHPRYRCWMTGDGPNVGEEPDEA